MQTNPDKLPPHSDDAERGVLACLLAAPENAAAMLAKLRRVDFYDLRHQTLFTAIVRIVRSGQSSHTVALLQYLKDKGELENAGGQDYLTALPDAIPSAANFGYYLPTIRDKAARRQVIQTAQLAIETVSDESKVTANVARDFTELAARILSEDVEPNEWLKFHTPSECRNYEPPPGHVIVGDYHIQKGAPFVIGGAPGVGKSRAAVALATAGATGGDWFGYKVHRQFKTMIVQAENGRVRLKNEFTDLDCVTLDKFVRVCSPPPFGFAFDKLPFCDQLRREIEQFQPDVFILDPFNRLARDDKAKDYVQAFEDLLAVLPTGDHAPALGIVAHTRKPRADERANGRALLNLLAGSYVIGSVPRTVFLVQAGSDDTTDNRIVWTCCKNNDGELGSRSAWERRNGLFVPVQDFDWKPFDGHGEQRRCISLDDLDTLFEGGKRQLARSAAVEQLMELTRLAKTACYKALKPDGKFSQHLKEQRGLLEFEP